MRKSSAAIAALAVLWLQSPAQAAPDDLVRCQIPNPRSGGTTAVVLQSADVVSPPMSNCQLLDNVRTTWMLWLLDQSSAHTEIPGLTDKVCQQAVWENKYEKPRRYIRVECRNMEAVR